MPGKPLRTVTAHLRYGAEEIPIAVSFEQRRRLCLTVSPDLSVAVKAPVGQSLASVLEFVQQRRHWISRKRWYFEQLKPVALAGQYDNGAPLLYLGRHYLLEILRGDDEAVVLGDARLTVTVSTDNRAQLRFLIERWYLEQAERVLPERFEILSTGLQLIPCAPELQVRPLPRRWGSCAAHSRIELNSELIKTPLDCIDYVIVHEMCHLQHANHSPQFYRLLSERMPDWRQRKQELDRYML